MAEKRSSLKRYDEPDGTTVFVLRLTQGELRTMSREQIEMLEDAGLLLEAALCGETQGPVSRLLDRAATVEPRQ